MISILTFTGITYSTIGDFIAYEVNFILDEFTFRKFNVF